MNCHGEDKYKTGRLFLFIIFIDCEITWQLYVFFLHTFHRLSIQNRNVTPHKRLMELTNSDLNKKKFIASCCSMALAMAKNLNR